MSLRKDPTVYSAGFRNLKLNAFGFDQVIRESFSVTVYQVTCRPAKWAARPQLRHGSHDWSGPSAEHVQKLVAADFEEQLSPWVILPAALPAGPSLRSAADTAPARKEA